MIAELTTAGATVREYIYLPEAEIAPTRFWRASGSTGQPDPEPAPAKAGVDIPVAVVDGVILLACLRQDTATPVLLNVHADHLGRPVRMTNAAKASVWSVEYTPWGAPHAITGAQTLNTRFPGQWFQLESGLHYNWHRHYDPSLGRYTQPDPLGFVDGPSVYAYAGSGPLKNVDKDGLLSAPQSKPPKPPTMQCKADEQDQCNPNFEGCYTLQMTLCAPLACPTAALICNNLSDGSKVIKAWCMAVACYGGAKLCDSAARSSCGNSCEKSSP